MHPHVIFQCPCSYPLQWKSSRNLLNNFAYFCRSQLLVQRVQWSHRLLENQDRSTKLLTSLLWYLPPLLWHSCSVYCQASMQKIHASCATWIQVAKSKLVWWCPFHVVRTAINKVSRVGGAIRSFYPETGQEFEWKMCTALFFIRLWRINRLSKI